ncbi:Leucine-rich repeat-containing protein 51 like protein [Aduncisulcus paluster]|uniref:Leucine-rich repeat-containing protein 51 like protein n=1 Tax=Aduncisulcus paluster TaxID=2918883 RepID=A0ABQ5KJF5_9EUKA|nr:Leucine-rich repeat-containing protein 51 like protein [Aduncisulcus paluster]
MSNIVDYSDMGIKNIRELLTLHPHSGIVARQDITREQQGPTTIKLCSNDLISLDGLLEVLDVIVVNILDVKILDISSNLFSSIPKEVLSLPGLKSLYLHDNKIEKRFALTSLTALNLYSLTLHANPIAKSPGLRAKLVYKLPTLKVLDFTSITARERRLLMGDEDRKEKASKKFEKTAIKPWKLSKGKKY